MQYRITVNGAVGPIEDTCSKRWAEIADTIESRGGMALLEQRTIIDYDENFIAGLVNPSGYMRLKDKLVSPWEVLAELGDHLPVRYVIGS